MRHVDAELEALGVDGGKAILQELAALVRDVEVDAFRAGALDFRVDGAGDDVARRERLRADARPP